MDESKLKGTNGDPSEYFISLLKERRPYVTSG